MPLAFINSLVFEVWLQFRYILSDLAVEYTRSTSYTERLSIFIWNQIEGIFLEKAYSATLEATNFSYLNRHKTVKTAVI